MPPIMITRTWGRLASSIAMFSAFVTTVSDFSFRNLMWRATSAVVVPESSITMSWSRISCAAALPMRTFSPWCSVSLTSIGTSCCTPRRFKAPPWERSIAPDRARASRSARTVTAETEKRLTSSGTVTRPWRSTRSRIFWRRSSTSSRGCPRAGISGGSSYFRPDYPWRVRVLFLGGTGNLSAACARLAVERGHSLTSLTRGQREVSLPAEVERLEGDATDAGVLDALAARRFDVVVNFIAFDEADVRRDVRAFAGRVAQYVFISSASVYEKPPRHHVVTEDTPLANPFWDYARKKIAAEQALREAHRAAGFPATIVRPCYTYGDSWIPTTSGTDYTVAWRMRQGLEVVVPGDGTS